VAGQFLLPAHEGRTLTDADNANFPGPSMTLKSMTGFGRADGSHGGVSWTWEVRTVNGRGLDVRLRLPPGSEALEPKVREMTAQVLTRGSVNVNLNVARSDGGTEIRLNERVLAQVLAAIEIVRAKSGAPPPTAEGLLSLRGVLEIVETRDSDAAVEARSVLMLASYAKALAGVDATRVEEGGRLAKTLLTQIADIERLTGAVTASPSRSADAIRKRLADNLARILEAGSSLDPARLHQEAAILATKADVEEELERLRVHVASARDMLAGSEPAGRRLDFLTQEFNREANTLCSKANAPDVTQKGLELKAIIDQMREQVQNIE
jgi:uncharacterized protein (TIGR00255 family)